MLDSERAGYVKHAADWAIRHPGRFAVVKGDERPVSSTSGFTRREFLHGAASASAALWIPGVFAQELVRTPRQTQGPFYPDRLPLDTDNDLVVLSDRLTPAVGEVTHLSGHVLGPTGSPVRNATVEIWQVDHNGAYIHSRSDNASRRDPNFQGFGRFETASDGQYRFRTIKPVPYPGRTAHIHVKVKAGDRELLTTQCYVKGEPGNARDSILRGIRDEGERESVIVDFVPVSGSTAGELSARFDIVLGTTPALL
jgi:protocatechuate 3,4-dioxygenase beta subunit